MAVNAPLQGTAADLMKVAMINLDKVLKEKYGEKVKMLVQVHDEVIFEVEEKLAKEISKVVKEEMENAIKLKVPVKVDVAVGDNWGSLN